MVNSFVNKTLAKYRYMHVTGQLLDYIYPKNLILMNNAETTNTNNNDILESKNFLVILSKLLEFLEEKQA